MKDWIPASSGDELKAPVAAKAARACRWRGNSSPSKFDARRIVWRDCVALSWPASQGNRPSRPQERQQ